jgi:hypothetical protein
MHSLGYYRSTGRVHATHNRQWAQTRDDEKSDVGLIGKLNRDCRGLLCSKGVRRYFCSQTVFEVRPTVGVFFKYCAKDAKDLKQICLLV